MKSLVLRYAAAACFLAALVWMLTPGSENAALAFAKMVDAVVSARSARFQVESIVEGQPKQTGKMLFLAPSKYRVEMTVISPARGKDRMDKTYKVITVSDWEAGKMLTLMPDQKQAVVANLKDIPKAGQGQETLNHFERLRRLLAEQRDVLPAYERLGMKTIDGKKAVGFRFASGVSTLTMWGDPKTGNPIRIENAYSGPVKTEAIMTQFEMNVELNAELFSLDAPRDFKVQSFDIDGSKPQERDFVESLRAYSGMSSDVFPDAIDSQTLMKTMFAFMSGKKDAKNQAKKAELKQEVMQKPVAFGRGLEWALNLPPSAKAHYAGKGVKLNTKDRPIFWYLPEGETRYRVIDARLSASNTDVAPQIEGAVPLFRKPPKND